MKPGLATYLAIAVAIALSVGACGGSLTATTPVTVLSSHASLVVNKNAPVTLLGSESGKVIEVGKVASIDAPPNGQTALHLAIDSSQLHLIPADVLARITPTAVELLVPATPSEQRLKAGQVLNADLSEPSHA